MGGVTIRRKVTFRVAVTCQRACCIAVIYAIVAIGLWRLKSRARIAVIVPLGLNVLLLGQLLINGILPALLGVAVSGICLNWFAANQKVFAAGV